MTQSFYQFGAPSPEAAPGENATTQTQAGQQGQLGGVRVNSGGVYRATFQDGRVTEERLGVQVYDPTKDTNGEAGLLATANRGGRPIPASDLKPDDMVHINGIEFQVKVAERMGLLKRTDGGQLQNVSQERFNEVTGAQPKAPSPDAPKAQPTVDPKLPSADAEAALSAINTASQSTVTRALAQAAAKGSVDAGLLNTLASEAKLEPEQMQGHLAKAFDGFTEQAKAYATSQGIPAELFAHFGEWARANHNSEATNAIIQHVQGRDPGKAYGGLIGKYIQNMDDAAPEFLLSRGNLANGTRPYRGPNGQIMVNVNGQVTDWKTAVKVGLIKLGK